MDWGLVFGGVAEYCPQCGMCRRFGGERNRREACSDCTADPVVVPRDLIAEGILFGLLPGWGLSIVLPGLSVWIWLLAAAVFGWKLAAAVNGYRAWLTLRLRRQPYETVSAEYARHLAELQAIRERNQLPGKDGE